MSFWLKLAAGGLVILFLSFWTTLTLLDNYIFVQPQVKTEGLSVEGVSGGWITSAGIIVNTNASDLMQFPFVVLEGPATLFISEPKPSAVIIDLTGKQGAPIPSKFKLVGSTYRVVIDARGAASTQPTPIKIALTFDRFFVPKDRGMSSDPRELVIMGPTNYEMRATSPK
jgi:hypothetical protein